MGGRPGLSRLYFRERRFDRPDPPRRSQWQDQRFGSSTDPHRTRRVSRWPGWDHQGGHLRIGGACSLGADPVAAVMEKPVSGACQLRTRPDCLIIQSNDHSDTLGRMRAETLANAGWLSETTQIISSGELKAIETAEIVSRELNVRVEVREAMHENDRSATGFVPLEEFEIVANYPWRPIECWPRA
jgi:hypothetical protein